MDTPPPSPTPQTLPPSPTPTPEATPTPTPTPEPTPAPECILRGEEIVSLCGTAFSHDAMITADGKLLAWGGEIPFDLEQCILRQDNGGYMDVYELPLENVTGAWLGRTSILALDKDGVLWGMGGNSHGQLWNTPVHDGWDKLQKLADHVVSADISQWSYSAAVKEDGGVWLMGKPTSGNENLPPTQIAKIKGAAELYVAPYLYVRDKDGVSWRLGKVGELLDDPTAVTLEPYPGIKWLNADLWLTDEGEVVRIMPRGEERILLTDVADVDLSYYVYATAVTRDGDLYVWNEGDPAEFEGLNFCTPTKVMEGVKLAGAWEHGVVVVTQADSAVWAIYKDTLEAAVANNELLVLPR